MLVIALLIFIVVLMLVLALALQHGGRLTLSSLLRQVFRASKERPRRMAAGAPPRGRNDSPVTKRLSEPSAGFTGLGGIELMTRPDLQPTQALSSVAAPPLASRWPLGLAVTALATGSVGYPQPDAYYVQRNVIALARGLNGGAAGQRAAALALSGMLTSPLGRTPDAAKALREGLTSANQLIRLVSGREPENSDMVTTLDAVFVAEDAGQQVLHFVHVGNGSIWLQRASGTPLELLTQSHSIDGGPVLRGVGVRPDLTPDVGEMPVEEGDRIFLTTASSYFAFPVSVMDSVTAASVGKPLPEVVATLADTARESAAPEGITVIAGEVTRSAATLS